MLGLASALAAAAPLFAQECGDSVNKGPIPKGDYTGAGGSSEEAHTALLADMGITEQECPECSSGCEWDYHVNGGKNIVWGEPNLDIPTHRWTQNAVVTADGVSWDSICTQCLD